MDIDTTERKSLVIISAATGSCDDDKRHVSLGKALKDHGFEFGEVEGCYKGVTEQSYLVEYEGGEELFQLFMLAVFYAQESVLVIDAERNAELMYTTDDRYEKLGKLEPISNLQAEKLDAWTRTSNGQYYGVLDNA